MPKIVRGRAGRQQRREAQLSTYGAELAPMLLKQMRVSPDARILHLGYPGASNVADAIAPALDTGEILLVVYSYDELEETRALLAGAGNVEVINDLDDLDPDEPPYDVVTCIVPYYLGRDYVADLLRTGLDLLTSGGTLFMAGDRQQGFERQLEFLGSIGSRVTPLVQNGQYRVVSATKPTAGGGLRRRPEGA